MFEEPMSWMLSAAGAGSVAFSALLLYLETLIRIRA